MSKTRHEKRIRPKNDPYKRDKRKDFYNMGDSLDESDTEILEIEDLSSENEEQHEL
jgi:hypothetical protein